MAKQADRSDAYDAVVVGAVNIDICAKPHNALVERDSNPGSVYTSIGGGMLVVNPIPEEYSMDYNYITKAVEDAVAHAKQKGVKGKAVTPFLLSEIKDITGGNSLAANIELVLSNARLAAKIARGTARA